MTMRAALAEGMFMANSEENADVVEATMNVIVCTDDDAQPHAQAHAQLSICSGKSTLAACTSDWSMHSFVHCGRTDIHHRLGCRVTRCDHAPSLTLE